MINGSETLMVYLVGLVRQLEMLGRNLIHGVHLVAHASLSGPVLGILEPRRVKSL